MPTWLNKPGLIKALRKAACPLTSRQVERLVERGLLPSVRESGGYKGGVHASYPLETAAEISRFLREADDLETAGLWAWYQGCPVPESMPKRLLYSSIKESWRRFRPASRPRTRGRRADHLDEFAWRSRFRARRLTGGTGLDAYNVVYQLLAVVTRLKENKGTDGEGEEDPAVLLDSLTDKLYQNIERLGVELKRTPPSQELVSWVESLNAPMLARVIRKATPQTLEEARIFLKSHLRLTAVVLVLSGLISPIDEPAKVRRVMANQLPMLVAGVLLFREFGPDFLAAMPTDAALSEDVAPDNI